MKINIHYAMPLQHTSVIDKGANRAYEKIESAEKFLFPMQLSKVENGVI